MTTPPREGTFKRLVRSLSRSGGPKSPGNERPPAAVRRASSRSKRQDDIRRYAPKGDENVPPMPSPSNGIAYSTSPPPDSYFPPPPLEVLQDTEASGRGRHPESHGARAFDIGIADGGHSAPGVTFAPSSHGAESKVRPDSELEGWRPPVRRSASQRVKRQPSTSSPATVDANGGNGNGNGGASNLSRQRSAATRNNGASAKDDDEQLARGFGETVTIGERTVDAGERRGVTLEDKPLSRKTSTAAGGGGGGAGVKRATSTFTKRAGKAFEPPTKGADDKAVLVLCADGTEEIELMTVYDVLVRASLSPVIVSVSPQFSPSHSLPHMTLSRGAKILADTTWEHLETKQPDVLATYFDAVVVPGGAKGAERLSTDKGVQRLVRDYYDDGKLVACICAGSLAAKTAGIGLGGRITSHPSVRDDLEGVYDYVDDERVVVEANLVTSRGPGTALEWALAIVEILAGEKRRDEVAGPMML
ncbi:uncharacterized protein RHOBADRAFT_52552 [Rhodotorula graminis WP1]|uniref:D-lactate dehydratase n=1 Tax=Rhodotorula graminis (strain WP1) TaxID=578459 RepID=A0A194SAY7_RHOGW|nr:uncharacterized protein RHOBADRAFT_52552 [Rhodotorula graminis WP1]KPV76561.1 hypothetical protein RHOBADRAFT_52552 [Rhodotorula graminis WP1]